MFLRHRGLSDFRIMKGGSFSVPVVFAAAVTVTRFLVCLPPVQLSSVFFAWWFCRAKLEKQSSIIGIEDVMRRVAMQVVLQNSTFPRSRLHFCQTPHERQGCVFRRSYETTLRKWQSSGCPDVQRTPQPLPHWWGRSMGDSGFSCG